MPQPAAVCCTLDRCGGVASLASRSEESGVGSPEETPKSRPPQGGGEPLALRSPNSHRQPKGRAYGDPDDQSASDIETHKPSCEAESRPDRGTHGHGGVRLEVSLTWLGRHGNPWKGGRRRCLWESIVLAGPRTIPREVRLGEVELSDHRSPPGRSAACAMPRSIPANTS